MRVRWWLRKLGKWGGVAFLTALLGCFVANGWYALEWNSKRRLVVQLNRGGVMVGLNDPPVMWTTGIVEVPDRIRFRFWWWPSYQSIPGAMIVYVPLWVIAVPVLVATVLAWRADARAGRLASAGACGKCGYSRLGLNADARCPECGWRAVEVVRCPTAGMAKPPDRGVRKAPTP